MCGKLPQLRDTMNVTPFPRRNGMSPEQTQCSVVKDDVPLCFTPNGLVGLLTEPIFLAISFLNNNLSPMLTTPGPPAIMAAVGSLTLGPGLTKVSRGPIPSR